MTYFAVFEDHGPGWNHGKGLREQERWDDHAVFMDALADQGVIRLGGPLGDGSKVLLIFKANSERAIRDRLAEDPWQRMGLLRITAIEPWEILLGDPG